MTALFRVADDSGVRLARGPAEEGPTEFLATTADVDELLSDGTAALARVLQGPTAGPVPAGSSAAEMPLLPPVSGQEVWASGVTFERSRAARNEEAGGADYYDRVYDAVRPELFCKAAPGRVRGTGQPIGIRVDSGWDVPEPELGLVADATGRLVAYTVGNDVSSRSIEGENPLYLPQAKVYTGSCGLGPGMVPVDAVRPLAELTVLLTIWRDNAVFFSDSVPLSQMRRDPQELLWWLFQAMEFPVGVVLLTGTSIVPPPEFTLAEGDTVDVHVPGVGTLTNRVQNVGRPAPADRMETVR